MTCHCVFTVVISVSVLLSMVAGAPTNGLSSSNDVARDSDLYTVLVEDNEWPELSSRYIQELSPLEPPEAVEYVHVQDDEDVNKRLQRLSGYSNFLLPEAFRKRGIYDAKRLAFFKRSSLNELIRRLMALRGNNYTDGRAYYMRFGAGKK